MSKSAIKAGEYLDHGRTKEEAREFVESLIVPTLFHELLHAETNPNTLPTHPERHEHEEER